MARAREKAWRLKTRDSNLGTWLKYVTYVDWHTAWPPAYDIKFAGCSTYVQKFPPTAIITKVSVQNYQARLKSKPTETAREANMAPIISTKGANGGTHVVSRVKLKMLIFTKKNTVYYFY